MSAKARDTVRIRGNSWIGALRLYLAIIVAANLVWEALHLPLYTVWREGTPQYLAFVVAHCTGGDLLIALSILTLALVLAAPRDWPAEGFARVALLATGFGVAYTVFSEWLNIVVRKSWAYSELMPVVPIIDTGLSPLLQWLIIPPVALWMARRKVMPRRHPLETQS